MTRQTPEPLDRVGLNVTNRRAKELVNMVDSGYLDVNPPYQRGSTWTTDQQIALVRSWLSGIVIPAVIINDRATYIWREANNGEDVRAQSAIYVVIDGKQRVETAIAWFHSELAVPASWFRAEDVESTEDTPDGPYVRYTGLTRSGRLYVDGDAMLPMGEGKLPTVRAEAEVYLIINMGGTPQSDEDMRNAARIAKEY